MDSSGNGDELEEALSVEGLDNGEVRGTGVEGALAGFMDTPDGASGIVLLSDSSFLGIS